MLANTRKALADLWSVSHEFMNLVFSPAPHSPMRSAQLHSQPERQVAWNSRSSLLPCAGMAGVLHPAQPAETVFNLSGHLCLGAKGSSCSCGWRESLGIFCEVECFQEVWVISFFVFQCPWLSRMPSGF